MQRMVLRARLFSLVFFAFVAGVWPMAAQAATNPGLGSAAGFAVLAGTAATCTTSTITGKVGVNFTPPITAGCNAQYAPGAYSDFRTAFTNGLGPCGPVTLGSTLPDPVTNLGPGTYCTGAALTFTDQTLNLTGTTGPWLFEIPAGLTATNLKVVMANGGNPCNVFWWVGADATVTANTTASTPFQGTILGGGAISLTGSAGNRAALTVTGRALATGAVTMTDTTIVGCNAAGKPGNQCKQGDGDEEDGDANVANANRTRDGKDEDGNGHKDCASKSDKDKDNDKKDKDKSHRHDSDKGHSDKRKSKNK